MDDTRTELPSPIAGRIEETSSGRFTAPDKIVTSAQMSRAMYYRMRQDQLRRIKLYREIEGLIGGAPPYNPNELRAAGLDHISNFNDMSAAAVYERASLAYWNLIHNSQYLIRFVLRGADPQLVGWAQIMSKNWDFVMKNSWPSFLTNLGSLTSQLVKFGISPLLFTDERDPRWRVVELSRFIVPDQTQSDLEMLTTVFIETDFTMQELWGIYQEFKKQSPEDKAKNPWNLDQLGRLLVLVSGMPQQGDVSNPVDWFELERKFLNGDLSWDNAYSNTVRIVSQFQKEYSGKISHYMFHPIAPADVLGPTTQDEFIFFQKDQYQSMRDATVIFTMNPGAYTIHGNKGIGHKIFALAQAKIQLANNVVDLAKWACTPIIKSSSLNSKDVEQIRFTQGVPTNIGTAEFVENTMGANVQGAITATQFLEAQINFNITYSGSDPSSPDPDQGSISPSQARLSAFREFSVLKNNIMHFYATGDPVVQNMTAKMLRSKKGYPGYELAEEWKRRCIEEGVLPEIFNVPDNEKDKNTLPGHIECYLTRAAGAGSQVAHLIGLQELQSIAGSFNAKEEATYKRQYISATVGPEFIEAYTEGDDSPDEASAGASLAGVENAVMLQGGSPIYDTANEDRAHVSIHMAMLVDAAKKLESGEIDPVAADKIFTVGIPHTGDHMEALERNPFAQQFVAQVKPGFQQIQQIAILNHKNAGEMLKKQAAQQQQDAEKTSQVMGDADRKDFTAQRDASRQDFKVAKSVEHQQTAAENKAAALAAKTATDNFIKEAKAQADIKANRQTTFAGINREAAKTMASIARDSRKTQSEIQSNRQKTSATPKSK